MGLLSRAAGRSFSEPSLNDGTVPSDSAGSPQLQEFSLDDIAEALKDRIRKLNPKKTTPYTALSLLKVYGSFQTGICLSLKGGMYTSYTSVGMGIEKVSVPMDSIWQAGRSLEKYFRLNPETSLGLKQKPPGLSYWAFPLNSGGTEPNGPWSEVMILGVLDHSEQSSVEQGPAEQGPAFNPASISLIIEGIAEKLVLPMDQNAGAPAVEPVSTEPDTGEGALEEPYEGEAVSREAVFEELDAAKPISVDIDFIEPDITAGTGEIEEIEPEEIEPEEIETNEIEPEEIGIIEPAAEAVLEETVFEEPVETENVSLEIDFSEPVSEEPDTAETPQGELIYASRHPNALSEKIAQFYEHNDTFNCILCEAPGFSIGEEEENFCQKITRSIDMAGTVIPLPDGRPLVLLPGIMDRELIAHRLSKTFNTELLLSFEADSPESALNRINSLY